MMEFETVRSTFLKRHESNCRPLIAAKIPEWQDKYGERYVYFEDLRKYLIRRGFEGELSCELTVTIIGDRIFFSQAEVVDIVCSVWTGERFWKE